MPSDLLINTPDGLYCPAGDFFIDPWRPRRGHRAIITHAHSDHARLGADSYLCARSGVDVLRARFGAGISVHGLAWEEQVRVGDCLVSLHQAGHVLGSSMVRIEALPGPHASTRSIWVVSGDYKTQRDCSGEVMQPVACDVFITESTFGLPVYRWEPRDVTLAAINEWWADCARQGEACIVYAYALGKAQSVLAGLDASIGDIFVHGAVDKFLPIYRAAGVPLPRCERATAEGVRASLARGAGVMVVAPPSADNSAWARSLARKGKGLREAFASGWMRVRGPRRRRGVDRGFVLSDHADWDGLLSTIAATGAQRVGVTHGFTGVLTRALAERGIASWELKTRFVGEGEAEAESEIASETEAEGTRERRTPAEDGQPNAASEEHDA
jgi:putative mRNA 3-end processing factor